MNPASPNLTHYIASASTSQKIAQSLLEGRLFVAASSRKTYLAMLEKLEQ
jgi:hypothetical protein